MTCLWRGPGTKDEVWSKQVHFDFFLGRHRSAGALRAGFLRPLGVSPAPWASCWCGGRKEEDSLFWEDQSLDPTTQQVGCAEFPSGVSLPLSGPLHLLAQEPLPLASSCHLRKAREVSPP